MGATDRRWWAVAGFAAFLIGCSGDSDRALPPTTTEQAEVLVIDPPVVDAGDLIDLRYREDAQDRSGTYSMAR